MPSFLVSICMLGAILFNCLVSHKCLLNKVLALVEKYQLMLRFLWEKLRPLQESTTPSLEQIAIDLVDGYLVTHSVLFLLLNFLPSQYLAFGKRCVPPETKRFYVIPLPISCFCGHKTCLGKIKFDSLINQTCCPSFVFLTSPPPFSPQVFLRPCSYQNNKE